MKTKHNAKILIVDDISDNIQIAMNILKGESYTFSFAEDGQEAIDLINSESFDLILLDVMMPNMDGFEVCRVVKSHSQHVDIPIIFLTAKADIDSISKGFEVGGVDYIVKPFHADELIARVNTHLELALAKQHLKQSNITLYTKAKVEKERLLSEIRSNQHEMICVLMEVMEATSDETGQHIKRVAEVSRLLAHYLPSLSADDEITIYHASPMHDIGKMAIPDEILHKPGRLSEAEFEIMKTHATKANQYLKNSPRTLIDAARTIANEHHEKWNGSGYPKGLGGEQIHIYGRIVALADVFDALTHKRQYKDGWTTDAAVAYIQEQRGSHFDPQLVDIFIAHLPEFVEIAEQE